MSYLLWSGKHGMWWAASGYGYTEDRAEAGRFTEEDAMQLVLRSAQCGEPDLVTRLVYEPDEGAER